MIFNILFLKRGDDMFVCVNSESKFGDDIVQDMGKNNGVRLVSGISRKTCISLSAGIALKSKLSRLFACREPGRLDPAPDHPPLAVDQLQLHQSGKELQVVRPPGGVLAGELGGVLAERSAASAS